MELEYDTPMFIDANSSKAKTIIKEQGAVVCRDFLESSYISSVLQNFYGGYIYISRKAMIGQKRRSINDSVVLQGFIIFNVSSDHLRLHSEVVCSRESAKGVGRELMNAMINYAKSIGIWKITFHTLPYERLIKYYESFGFIRGDAVYKRDSLKAYEMSMVIDYSSENNEEDCDCI